MNSLTRNAVLSTSFIFIAGCTGTSAEGAAPRSTVSTATQYVVGIDISGSRTGPQLKEEEDVVLGLINRMTYGDRIVLVETYRSGLDSAGQWQDSIPVSRFAKPSGGDKRRLDRFRMVATQMAGTFFDPDQSRKIMSTDLFHTLTRAADYARAGNGRKTTVVLLSDMLQSTREVNMERAGGIPSTVWINAMKSQQRLPDLAGVCVFVAGADPTTNHGALVRVFWSQYFKATGANLPPENYRNMVADPGAIRCNSDVVRGRNVQ
jgi:hypothetical protein